MERDLVNLLEDLLAQKDLTSEQAYLLLTRMIDGDITAVQTAAFLVALRVKGEASAELTGFARAMRDRVSAVDVGIENLVDTAGTGGGLGTFNVSTTAALIAAAAGCHVAKHGNRSATGRSGSADLLQALGAQIELTPDQVARCIRELGFGFMFAPLHHAATRRVVPVRQELAVRTIFNLLGPLTNPAGAQRQLIGVSHKGALEPMAQALCALGTQHALIVHGVEGIDEVSATGTTIVYEVTGSDIQSYELKADQLGVSPVDYKQLKPGTPEQNAKITREILAAGDAPERSLALVNAGTAIYLAGGEKSIVDGVKAAVGVVDNGDAMRLLDRYVALTSKLSGTK